MKTKRFVNTPIYELRPDEKCAGCNGFIHPTNYGQFTMFVLDTETDNPYHGDCVPNEA